MKVLAIDQSLTCTGWCLFEGEELLKFGTIRTSKEDGSLLKRCYLVSHSLGYLVRTHLTGESDRVVNEALSYGSVGAATRNLAYLLGHIHADLLKESYSEVAPTSLKKFATGSGRAKKQDMLEALPKDILERFQEEGYKKSTGLYDLTDAYFIGKYFMKEER